MHRNVTCILGRTFDLHSWTILQVFSNIKYKSCWSRRWHFVHYLISVHQLDISMPHIVGIVTRVAFCPLSVIMMVSPCPCCLLSHINRSPVDNSFRFHDCWFQKNLGPLYVKKMTYFSKLFLCCSKPHILSEFAMIYLIPRWNVDFSIMCMILQLFPLFLSKLGEVYEAGHQEDDSMKMFLAFFTLQPLYREKRRGFYSVLLFTPPSLFVPSFSVLLSFKQIEDNSR